MTRRGCGAEVIAIKSGPYHDGLKRADMMDSSNEAIGIPAGARVYQRRL